MVPNEYADIGGTIMAQMQPQRWQSAAVRCTRVPWLTRNALLGEHHPTNTSMGVGRGCNHTLQATPALSPDTLTSPPAMNWVCPHQDKTLPTPMLTSLSQRCQQFSWPLANSNALRVMFGLTLCWCISISLLPSQWGPAHSQPRGI